MCSCSLSLGSAGSCATLQQQVSCNLGAATVLPDLAQADMEDCCLKSSVRFSDGGQASSSLPSCLPEGTAVGAGQAEQALHLLIAAAALT